MRQDILPRFLCGSIAVALSTAATLAGAAGPRQAPDSEQVRPEFTKVIDKQLVSTSVQGDSARYSLNAGFTNIGVPIPFKCTKACTIMVHAMVQVEQASPYWAICPQIDGVDAVDGCNWQGLASSTSSVYVTGGGVYFWSLSAGKHTFQPQVYLSVAGALDNWSMTIAEYQ